MPTAPRELLDGCRRSRHDGAGRASRRNPPRTSGQRGAVPGRTPVGTPGRGRARAQPGAGVSPLPPPPVPPSAPLGPPTEILPQPLQLRPQLEHSGLGAQQAEPQPRVLLAGTVPLAQPHSPQPPPTPRIYLRGVLEPLLQPRDARAPPAPLHGRGKRGRAAGPSSSGCLRAAEPGRAAAARGPRRAQNRAVPPGSAVFALRAGRGPGGPARIPAAVLIPRPNGPRAPAPLGSLWARAAATGCVRPSSTGLRSVTESRTGEGRVLSGAVRLRSRELRLLLQEPGLAPGCCWHRPCPASRLLHACGAGGTKSGQRFMLKKMYLRSYLQYPHCRAGELTHTADRPEHCSPPALGHGSRVAARQELPSCLEGSAAAAGAECLPPEQARDGPLMAPAQCRTCPWSWYSRASTSWVLLLCSDDMFSSAMG